VEPGAPVHGLVSRPWVRIVTIPVAVLAIYFVVPVDTGRAPIGVLAGILISVAALVGVVMVVYIEARDARHRMTGWHLVLVLEIALMAFSFAYYLVASNAPGQFAGLVTRLDAMYFSTATAATVGYGDVHPIGQLARALVTLHMLFNIVFIAAVVNLARDRMSERRAAAHADAHDDSAADG
jgi:voltage-gated potassium channel